MYSITAINGDGTEYPLLELTDYDFKAMEPEIEETINSTSTFSFLLPAENLNYDKVKKLESEIIVYDLDGNAEIFRGRCTSDETDFYNTKRCICEGSLAYLMDSKHGPYNWEGTVHGFMEELIGTHNSKVRDKQKVYLGLIQVEDPNHNFKLESKDYEYTLKIIQENIIGSFSGLLQMRRTNGKNYLDYLADYPVSDQIIRFGENILELTRYSKADEIRTVIIPLGAEIEDTQERQKINSVNNGIDYLLDQTLVDKYGWIEETVEFEDVTQPEELMKKGQKYLDDCKNMSLTIELSAVDGRLLGLDVGRVKPGMLVRVISEPHGIDTKFLCTSKTTNLLSPNQDKITLGNQFVTYTESVNKIQKEYEETVQKNKSTMLMMIKKTQDDFKEALENAKGLYHTVDKDESGAEIHYLHDKKNLNDSDIRIKVNKAGIGLTADAGQHWYGFQVDGTMIAEILNTVGVNASWIRTGVLSAALIQAGILEDKKGHSRWNLETGEFSISGSFTQRAENGKKAIEIDKNRILFMDYEGDESYIGDISAYEHLGMSVGFKQSGNLTILARPDEYLSPPPPGQGYVNKIVAQFTESGIRTSYNLTTNWLSANDARLKSISTNYLDMSDGKIINIKNAKSGKALFSDGSFLEFENGILIGGQTSGGTKF